jgi:metal-responsive CopG/Arc/MetJ family transcriptional regulator
MIISARSAPLRKGRRISINVNLAPDIHRELGKIAKGNRSAAIEHLVRQYIAERTKIPEPIT